MKRACSLVALLAALCLPAQAGQPVAPDFVQRVHAPLPLGAAFTDAAGRAVLLGDYFDTRPVLLVLGYYHCPNLCSTLMDGVLQSIAALDLAPRRYRIVAVSIDPRETAPLAASRLRAWQPLLGRRGGQLALLTGSAEPIARLAGAAGFRYRYDAALGQYAHPAGFLIANASGRITHYFMGVRFDPAQVRLALVDAAQGRFGTPAERLLLLCSHFDPDAGRYTVAAMALVRAGALLAAVALAGMLWRLRRRARSHGAPP